jgi:hypothetical protein
MRKLGLCDAFSLLCKSIKKWGVYISFIADAASDVQDIERAAPYLDWQEDVRIFANEHGIILCDTKDEMESVFNKTVGDDGPTSMNPYDGPVRVYALTCGPDGTLLNENT